jgi:DNA repair exonuclease SbcCD ATPase subunit
MKIVRLQAENFKRLVAAEVMPDGNVVVLGGENSAGKSSLLDSITAALGGKRAIPDEPIRKGTPQAKVVVETEELTVTRKFTTKGTTLEVKGKDGLKLNSPQKVLDALVGRLTFDPLDFARLEPIKQLETLRDLSGCDIEDIEKKASVTYDERTELTREVKSTQARMEASPYHKDAPEAETSVVELVAEIDQYRAANEERRAQRQALDDLRTTNQEIKLEIAETEGRLKGLRENLADCVKGGKAQAAKVAALGDDMDWQPLQDRIATAEEDNAKVRENAEHARLVSEWEAKCEAHAAMTAKLRTLDLEKKQRLAEAKLPVAGLGFGDAGITLNGMPFEQAGQAERIRVSVAMGIALNPELRVLLVRDASLLDANSLRIVAELAEKHDSQVWLERVGDGDECGVIIENGQVREAVKGSVNVDV